MAKQRKKKKNQRFKGLIIILIVVAVALAGYVWYTWFRIEEAKFARYPGFGIELPRNYPIHGIDVSRHQSFIYWPAVKNMKVRDVKIGFSFIKATEGKARIDRQFRRNWMKAADAGLARGAYHFFIPTKSGKSQAENFIRTVKLEPGDLPPVLDIEQLYGVNPAKMRKEIKDWLQLVEHYYGVRPIIYTYVNFYTCFLGNEFDRYPLWVAHYRERNSPRINRPWLFWQHNEQGRVNGITSKVDFNVFNGDSIDFKNVLVK